MSNKLLAKRFELASEEKFTRTIASVEGGVGTGKTFFGCSAKEPILYQDIDLGAEGVIEEFREAGKEIYHEKYVFESGALNDDGDEIDGDELQKIAKEVRNKWEKDFFYALNNGASTIVWDTESRIWQCHRYAEFGSPKADNPRDFDELNARFEKMINAVKARTDVSLLLIRSMKDKWGMVGPVNRKTGKKGFGKAGEEAWGYEHLSKMVMTELTFLRLAEDDDTRVRLEEEHGEGSCEFVIRFGKCRQNGSLSFTTVPRMSFANLGELLVDGSSSSDWE